MKLSQQVKFNAPGEQYQKHSPKFLDNPLVKIQFSEVFDEVFC